MGAMLALRAVRVAADRNDLLFTAALRTMGAVRNGR
jgi:hypothetical protein